MQNHDFIKLSGPCLISAKKQIKAFKYFEMSESGKNIAPNEKVILLQTIIFPHFNILLKPTFYKAYIEILFGNKKYYIRCPMVASKTGNTSRQACIFAAAKHIYSTFTPAYAKNK